MLISELTRHYNSNTNSSKKNSTVGTKGVAHLISSARELGKGNIFEGTVNSIKGGQVVLGLANGTVLSAKLDGNIELEQGQSMFFEVKSNDGTTIAIRPYMVDEEAANPTLINALKAANLSIEARYLSMVNAMMQEQMPIDKNSMIQMARILMANPEADVQTLVQMKKCNLPINAEMIAQFENYRDDTNALHFAIRDVITELPTVLGNQNLSIEQMKHLDSQFLEVLSEGMQGGKEISEENILVQKEPPNQRLVRGQMENIMLQEISVPQKEEKNSQIESPLLREKEYLDIRLEDAIPKEENTSISRTETIVEKEVLTAIWQTLGDIGVKAGDTSGALLQKLAAYIENTESLSKTQLIQLFTNKEIVTFLQARMEEQFLLLPQEVAEVETVRGFYERLQTKMHSLETILRAAGGKTDSVIQTIQDIRGNIQFMNEINEIYTFMQIPLKMSNQQASGQLYVYTNKNHMGNSEKELTAFLHLDLENLGATDISVRMQNREVKTKFYMETDESFTLIKTHMPILEERIRKKGYHCSVEIIKEEHHVNFVENFLKKDAPSAGQLHRYSFDMRA